MKITFHGATETVTGSNFELTTSKGEKILIDCGLFQGPKEIKERNYSDFPFNPADIDVLLLTHAHIDHSGLIPKLCRMGFRGKIFTTIATRDLCSIVLPDSGHIQEMEVERKNRKLARANKPLLEPIYTVEDAEKAIEQFRGVQYNTEVEILPGITAIFKDAGHILGSAMIELFVEGKKFLFSGDIGNLNQPIINDPSQITTADYIIMESTYGNRFHLETEDKVTQLARVIKKTMQKGGNLIIPAFAIERTQELIYDLRKLTVSGEIPQVDVYIDSPLAIRATEVFCRNPEFYDEEAASMIKNNEECILDFPGLKFSLSTEESIKLNQIKKNTIIISASGMCDAGRIKHHLKHNLWRPECTVLFVGYQAQGTLGRRILEGEKTVKIHGEEIAVKADIERIEGFSAHADQRGLVEWVNNFTANKSRKIFLVHGEKDSLQTLAKTLKEETDNNIYIPQVNETIVLEEEKVTPERQEKVIADTGEDIKDLFVTFEKKLADLSQKDHSLKLKVLEELNKLKEKFSN